MNNFWEKLLRKIKRQNPTNNSTYGTNSIRINPNPPSTRPSYSGRITIQRINNHPPTGGICTPVPVERPDLGGGIHVNQLRKPNICPMCRSKGMIVENTDGSGKKWKCTQHGCGYIF